jgi:hypothetical protein
MELRHSTMKSLSIPSQFWRIFQALNSEKCIPNFVKIGHVNFVATNVKKYKTRRKTFTLNTLSWLRRVFETIRPVHGSILLF